MDRSIIYQGLGIPRGEHRSTIKVTVKRGGEDTVEAKSSTRAWPIERIRR